MWPVGQFKYDFWANQAMFLLHLPLTAKGSSIRPTRITVRFLYSWYVLIITLFFKGFGLSGGLSVS